MSDYLTRLLARSTASLPVLKPRLPSRFESAVGGPLLPAGLKDAGADEISDGAAAEGTPGEFRPSRANRRTGEPQTITDERPLSFHLLPDEASARPLKRAYRQPQDEVPETPTPAHAPESPPVAVLTPPHLSTILPPISQPLRAARQQEDASSVTTEADSVKPAAREGYMLPQSPSGQDTARGPSGEQLTERAVVERLVTREAPPPNQPPAVDPASPRQPQEAALPVVIRPQVTPYVEPRRPALAEPPPEPETVINITINRLEVRANLQPTGRPAPRPASPVMSLADYLRERGGER